MQQCLQCEILLMHHGCSSDVRFPHVQQTLSALFDSVRDRASPCQDESDRAARSDALPLNHWLFIHSESYYLGASAQLWICHKANLPTVQQHYLLTARQTINYKWWACGIVFTYDRNLRFLELCAVFNKWPRPGLIKAWHHDDVRQMILELRCHL